MGDNSRNTYNLTILSKPLLDPIFDVEPVFEVRFDSKGRLEGVLIKSLRVFLPTPVVTRGTIGASDGPSDDTDLKVN